VKRAAIYARYSSEGQREASIEDQVRNCIKLIEDCGWQVAGTYSDRGISGATTLRAGYQRLLEDARNLLFDVLVVEGLDRLSRDPEATAALYKRMSFHGIAIVTRIDGEVNELHIGVKGAMNAIALKDLAMKTHRGIEGRVRQGKSGGGRAYGYRVVKQRDAKGEPVRGLREIEPAEAENVRRIFREFAAGRSPRAIARGLNADGVSGPTGRAWQDTTIRGHATRRTGILRNDLYVGRLLWNKQTYVRDPSTGKRLARVRKAEENIAVEVPELRIVEQDLWDAVQDRLQAMRSLPSVSKSRATEFWKLRRPKHLFTGLIRCGCCGGSMQAVGQDYLACAKARNGAGCDNRQSVRRNRIEEAVLEGLKTQLMAPELVEEFIRAFHEELNRQRVSDEVRCKEDVHELGRVSKTLRGLYDAIADGLRTPGLQQELLLLEGRQVALKKALEDVPPPAPRFHPRLADHYRELVGDLHLALNDPEARTEAAEILRTLVTRIEVSTEATGTVVTVTGDIVKLLTAPGGQVPAAFESSVKVVAGVGFEPTTFRL
jgi:site-specific DNA recombinase